jgi:hypothetical protein
MAQTKPTAWVGWVYFASVMMILAGGLEIIAGLVALLKDDFYVVAQRTLIAFNFTTWGWIHLIVGVLLVSAGVAVLAGSLWARVIAVFLAVSSLLANLAFLNAYPIWSITAIVINALVIYALTIHGNELKS